MQQSVREIKQELLHLERQIFDAWDEAWKDRLPIRPFPLSRNVESAVWFVGEMPSSSGERFRESEPEWPNWAATATDRLFETLRSRFGFEQAYLTDLVKAGPGRSRRPEPREIEAFWPFFEREMTLLRPRLIVALGHLVQRHLLSLALKANPISEHSHLQSYVVCFHVLSHPVILMRIPHPAYAVRWNKVHQLEDALHEVRAAADQADRLASTFGLTTVAKPKGPQRDRSLGSRVTEQQRAYHEFFVSFLKDWKARTPYQTPSDHVGYRSWISFSAGRSGFRYCFAFAQGTRFRVELYIDTGGRSLNKKAFDLLREETDEIGRELGQLVEWERIDERRACRISVYKENCQISDAPEDLADLREWAVQAGMKFRGVMSSRIRQLEL